MQTNLNTPPTEWPRVTVGGRPFLMRYTQASLLLLMEWAVPVGKINLWLDEERAAGRGGVAELKMALATLGNFDSSGEWNPLCARPEVTVAKFIDTEWATIIGQWPNAMGKVAQPAPPTQAAPTETGPAVQ